MSPNEQHLLDAITEAVLQYDVERVRDLTQQVVVKRLDPLRALEDGLGRGLRQVGALFGRREAFLPEPECTECSPSSAVLSLRHARRAFPGLCRS